MKDSTIQRAVSLAVVGLGLVAAGPVFAQTGAVSGRCTDEKGNVMVGYPVVLERQEVKGVYKTKTNKKGEYVYMGLPLGRYKVTLQDPAGRTIFSMTQHVGLDPTPTVIDFDMAKERAQQAKENPEAAKQQELQEKEAKQFAGLKTLFDQGQALYDQKKYPEAAATFEQALPLTKEGDRNQIVVLQHIGDCYEKAHQYDKAVVSYQKVLAAFPNDGATHNNLGSVYANMDKTPEAQAEFEKAAQVDPANASHYYFNEGVVFVNKGKMDEALEVLKKVTAADPKFADAYFWEGQALFGKATTTPDGKVTALPGTVEAFQTYLQLEPTGQYADQAKAVIETIQGTVQTEYKKTKKKG
jgi:tetratricopeptide (TPR) repeat protein